MDFDSVDLKIGEKMKIGENEVADWFLDDWCVYYNKQLHREGPSAPGIPRQDLVIVRTESKLHDGSIPEQGYLLINPKTKEILEEMTDVSQIESTVSCYRMVVM